MKFGMKSFIDNQTPASNVLSCIKAINMSHLICQHFLFQSQTTFLIKTKSAASCKSATSFATLFNFAHHSACLHQTIFHYHNLLHAICYDNHLFLPVLEWNIWFCCRKSRPASKMRKPHEARPNIYQQVAKLPPNHPQSIDNCHHTPHTSIARRDASTRHQHRSSVASVLNRV